MRWGGDELTGDLCLFLLYVWVYKKNRCVGIFFSGRAGRVFCVAIRVGKQVRTIISKETQNVYIQFKRLAYAPSRPRGLVHTRISYTMI